jgi:hypothetical protein
MKLPSAGSACPYCRAHKSLTRRRRATGLILAVIMIVAIAAVAFAINWLGHEWMVK